jgi:mannosyltransferase OCH1-like enzyme
MIPPIIHQTWKTKEAPAKWKAYVQKVQDLNPGWEYRLWSDEENDAFVKKEFPDFYATYQGFAKNIMRADVIRYLLMYKIGGVYLDLDYEVLSPFDFAEHTLILPMNRSKQAGDHQNELGNCFFASTPGHPFWLDVINDLKDHPPVITEYTGVVEATGPRLLTRIYNQHTYSNVHLPERMEYHPPTPRNKKEYNAIVANGISKGIHHCWGSWKERFTWAHLKKKIFK